MFQVKIMRSSDFQFATDLANGMNWNMAIEDFAQMKKLEPDGCFVIYGNSVPIGIATCIGYKTVGWFGNLVVKDEYRKQGAGRFLVEHAINYLASQGVKSVGLYAYSHLSDFYGSIGFKTDEDFVVLKGKNIQATESYNMSTEIQEQNIKAIASLDSECFGGNREKLLHLLLSRGHFGRFVVEKDEVVGFVIAKVYEKMIEVGPLVCWENRNDVALKLLNTVLDKFTNNSVYLYVPKKQISILSLLAGMGFQEEFSVIRMFLDKPSLKNCIYIAESLERG